MGFIKHRMYAFACYLITFMLMGLIFCTQHNFGNVTFDQMVFAFVLDSGGAFQVDRKLIFRYVLFCLILPGFISLLLTNLRLSQHLLVPRKVRSQLKVIPVSRHLRKLLDYFPVFLLIGTLMYVSVALNMQQFLSLFIFSEKRDYYSDHYVPLNSISLAPNKQPDNLLIIYVESLEKAYQEPLIFGKNLLTDLSAWYKKGIYFGKFYQMPGTGWTLGGIIATQCGIPLKFYNNHQSEHLKTFLPNATCLTDVLSQAGFHNVFIKGGSLRFAGLGKFLKSHHYQETYGKEEWLRKGYSLPQMSWWGLYDEDLYGEAKSLLQRLMKSKRPFSLTMLTVDLHGPDGQISPACLKRGARDFQGLVMCQSSMLSTFLHELEQKGWLKKINVVIMGDHLAMKNPVADKLNQAQQRTIFNLILPTKPLTKNIDEVVHFSWLPTILTLLNFDVPNGRAGLGFSAIEESDQPKDLARQHHDSIINMPENLMRGSQVYQALWG